MIRTTSTSVSRLACVLAAALSAPAGALGAETGDPGVMRVRIVEAAPTVALAGDALRVADRPVAASRVLAKGERGLVHVGRVASRTAVRVGASPRLIVDGSPVSGDVSVVPRADGALDVISRVPLETYVARILAGEVYADWPMEALKAQAVVARTYALHQRTRQRLEAHDVESSVISQKLATGAISPRLVEAAAATRGEFLSWAGEPILAVFHSSAGGHTASAEEVWGRPLPYLRSVESPDDGAPHFFWSYEIGRADLRQALREAGVADAGGSEVRVSRRSASGRVRELSVGGVTLSGRELRQVLGGAAIRSALFDVRVEGDRVSFLGSGSGHGVGLCQWGAHELARRGQPYRDIVKHYYPGAELNRLAEAPGARARWSEAP